MITVTTFPDVQASRLVARTFTLDELEQRLSDPREYARKSDCPLVKLARFGEIRSPAGSLRHDANVIEITGVEADYDAGEIAFVDAVGALFDHGIEALVYTSASHTPERPRWRILCPLSHPYPPGERARFVARLNGIFGGALAPESFALSQSFYIGRVTGAPYQFARTRGEFLDRLDGLDAGAIYPARNGQSRAERLAEVRSSDPVVARLTERGLVRRQRSDGAVDIVCPFADEHTTPDVIGDCTYFPAHTGGFARGHFHCLHGHCAARTDADFLAAVGMMAEAHARPQRSKQSDAHIDGAELLDAVHAFVCRFVAYPSADAAVAHTLWIAHAHLMDAWESTPRIAFLSPEPGSGKTRALEITETLVPRPVEAVNATPAYLFRKVSDPAGLPTILYDEIDTLFGPKAKDNEEIRGILNAGHRRGAMAGRCVVRGKIIETEELPAYCAVAMAGLGNLPDTILTRSVVIRMRRRAPTEQVEPYRRRLHAPDGNAIRDASACGPTRLSSMSTAGPRCPLVSRTAMQTFGRHYLR
jgi:hypothetical protein